MSSDSQNIRRRPWDVAMKDSWSHGEDRSDRGVDRGVTRQPRSRSPAGGGRRALSDREAKADNRGAKRRASPHSPERRRDQSRDRRRHRSRSPIRDAREDVRERNRGRELLDTRGSEKHRRSGHRSSPARRRKSQSPSLERSHHKRPKRRSSRSRSRGEAAPLNLSRSERKRRDSPPPRKSEEHRRESRSHHEVRRRRSRDYEATDRHRRSRSPDRSQLVARRRPSPTRKAGDSGRDRRSPPRSPDRGHSRRNRSPVRDLSNKSRPTSRPSHHSRRSPDHDRYEPSSRPRHASPPRDSREPRDSRDKSPEAAKHNRNERRLTDKIKSVSPAPRPSSRAASVEANMSGRGNHGQHHGYTHPNQQMHSPFPQQQLIDTRHYSQSPQHVTSQYGSPQAQSPFAVGSSGWAGQQQFSPHHQYPPNYAQGGYTSPLAPTPQQQQQQHFHQGHSQSPPYSGSSGPMQQGYQQQAFRGNGRGNYRGNNFDPAKSGYRGRGGQYQNPPRNSNNSTNPMGQNHSGSATPQQASPSSYSVQNSQQSSPQHVSAKQTTEDDDDNPFRPSKELQVEDNSKRKATDEESMPPPNRPTPSGSQSSKFSFAFKGPSKPTSAALKPEISQKLTAVTARKDAQTSGDRGRSSGSTKSMPTESASSRSKTDSQKPREPAAPRIVKKIMRRPISKPTLPTELAASDSVYFRKPGNESVVGSGTYGKVFKAIHVYTKKLVALKKIRMEGERDGFPVTAVREIKLLQSLRHPNVVHLQEVMVEKNDCFMVFEYLSHDLTGLLNHPSFKLEPAHKKHLAKQLFEGLDYLHRRGVLHRDIKAANILVSTDGLLKLADFGLARFYTKRRALDYTNRVVTIWYRSPELLLGETQYGPAVDVWSAACVLVEIFTRHAIFPGDGGEISQLERIYAVLGTPSTADWPGLVDMAWFQLLRPAARRPNVFAEKYRERVTPAAFELLEAMFLYDPAKRPTASDVLEYPYFTVEEPAPRQAIELQTLEGDWHEFESKALRKENERLDKEARKARKDAEAKTEAESEAEAEIKGDDKNRAVEVDKEKVDEDDKDKEKDQEREKKRASDDEIEEREAKRVQTSHPSEVAVVDHIVVVGGE